MAAAVVTTSASPPPSVLRMNSSMLSSQLMPPEPRYCMEETWTLRSEAPGVRVMCVSVAPDVDMGQDENKLTAPTPRSRQRFILIGLNSPIGSYEMRMGINGWKAIDAHMYEKIRPKHQVSKKGENYVDIDFLSSINLMKDQVISELLDEVMELETLQLPDWKFVILDYTLMTQGKAVTSIEFVCHNKDTDRWFKESHGNKNFNINMDNLFTREHVNLTREVAPILNQSKFNTLHKFEVHLQQRVVNVLAAIATSVDGAQIDIYVQASRLLRLHWGGSTHKDGSEWQRVSTNHIRSIPDFTNIVIDQKAIQTKFNFINPNSAIQVCKLDIAAAGVPEHIVFVLKEEEAPVWINNNGKDFVIPVRQREEWIEAKKEAVRKQAEMEAAAEARRQAEAQKWGTALARFQNSRPAREENSDVSFSTWRLQDDVGEIDCSVYTEDAGLKKVIVLEIEAISRVPLTLHWGCVGVGGEIQRRRDGSQWICPPKHLHPVDTVVVDPKQAVQTPMDKTSDFCYSLKITFPATAAPVTNPTECGFVAEFGGVVFVLKEAPGNKWYKAMDGRDILVRLTTSQSARWTGAHKQLVDQIVEAEVEWDHMTLMHRYNLCNELISSHYQASVDAKTPAEIDSEHAYWAWIFTWNRFSFLCWLDWQRRYNTKPRDLSHATESLSCKVASFWKSLPRYRIWLKMILTTMGRGGSAGQAIRDRILDIMHKHKIPETAGNFYEQWHQKLHNNTTRDDIGICRAVIKYLESNGNMGVFWDELHHHGITRETLASYDRHITLEPFLVNCDRGSLIYDFRQYLDILQEVHDALDLHKSAQRVKHVLKGEAQSLIDGVIWECGQGVPHNFHDICGRLNRIYRIRRSIIESLVDCNHSAGLVRDLLLLDSGLETQQSILMQSGVCNGNVAEWTGLLIEFIDIVSRHDPENIEWRALAKDWSSLGVAAAQSRYCPDDSKSNALLLKALIDRLTRAVGDMTDLYQTKLGEPSLFLGIQVGVERSKLNVFVDEVLRGTILFAISLCVRSLEPIVRKQAELPPWQLISWVPKTKGVLVSVKELTALQEKVFETPTVLISDGVNGEEEIPNGVQGVLVRSASHAPDILSHISVRARNAHCLLAVCFNPDVISEWEAEFQDKWVELEVIMGGSNLSCKLTAEPEVDLLSESPDLQSEDSSFAPDKSFARRLSSRSKLGRRDSRSLSRVFDRKVTQSRLDELDVLKTVEKSITRPINFTDASPTYYVTVDGFNHTSVGSKSLNLKALKSKLNTILTPRAFALPYGSLQKVLNAPENVTTILPALDKIVANLRTDLESEEVSSIFRKVRAQIMSLKIPDAMKAELKDLWNVVDSTTEGGVTRDKLETLYENAGEAKCWEAVCKVWASMFAMRPWISLAKANRSFMDLNMAVLVQELVHADFAFVLHTRNPFRDHKLQDPRRQMYGEIVNGLGEVLVANYPGRALSFVKYENESAKVVAFPAKSEALIAKGSLIFRSDSNGEDLEGFAGAGLFESIPAIVPEKMVVSYEKCPLVNNHKYRQNLIDKIGEIAFKIEDTFGKPMDIEGCVTKDRVVIVQARPQV
eukprot:Blabericola_migrator_1__1003@NODE_1252_length_4978_cov_140_400733_g846_i0_p1_GENE_NODE_1252_length_4978_cov_140_400733_g846_i0NODE_1252_length_4978_cov_140_400733_g846_i0_p1_ORF_typecomplete_len1569_score346_11PPDK_N/PF01326_19/5_7e25PPDK_N/PF01326_19/0_0021PPDK_N/PF01326_19/7_2e08Mad3_BUB1_I/PF08311_12/2_3Mad3_BUB1_I/PF08311_12/54CBM53/PF16760_5/7_7e02CBM53/PF16760_5/1_1e04CBM53/PF16760_5/0_72_NODE_1252_length_4978_cov_140_400733_g846_i0324738